MITRMVKSGCYVPWECLGGFLFARGVPDVHPLGWSFQHLTCSSFQGNQQEGFQTCTICHSLLVCPATLWCMLICPMFNIASVFVVPSDSPPVLLLFSSGPVQFNYYSPSTNRSYHTHPAQLPGLLPIVTFLDFPSGLPGTGPSPITMLTPQDTLTATTSRVNKSLPASEHTPLLYLLTSSHSLVFLPSNLSLLCYIVSHYFSLLVSPVFKRSSSSTFLGSRSPVHVFSNSSYAILSLHFL